MITRIYYTSILMFLLLSMSAYSQWNPTPSPPVVYRYDDVYFLNPLIGWAVNYATLPSNGMVIKTVDGGLSWQTVYGSSGAAFRDVGFTDSLHGWIGTLESGQNPEDTVIMYQTTDGGMSWVPVQNFPGPSQAGICGMCVINDSTVYACGRYYGPAGFYKTTNNGQSWSYTDLSVYAGGLVDIYFTSPDSGFVVGTSGDWFSDSGIVLFTSDGGNTWQVKHTSTHNSEICWKISFPSANVGYVSLESFRGTGPQYFLKTTDGGMTWQDMSFTNSGTYDAEGIGFINDSTGWVGGGSFNYKTTDGGLTWSEDSWGSTVNRFRFFSDTLGYAAGAAIYKFEDGAVTVMDNSSLEKSLVHIFPNPYVSDLSITVQKSNLKNATIILRNILGETIYTKEEKGISNFYTGRLELGWTSPGVYFLEVIADGERIVNKLIRN
jgi:photosystem II stability/assembly factor-like uncharacterized protein